LQAVAAAVVAGWRCTRLMMLPLLMAAHPADDAPPVAKRGRPTIDVSYAVHLVINEHLPIREALAKLNKIRESEEQKNVSVSTLKRGLALAQEQQRQKSAAESGAIASAAAAARRRLASNSAPIATCGGKKRKALLFNNVVFEMTDKGPQRPTAGKVFAYPDCRDPDNPKPTTRSRRTGEEMWQRAKENKYTTDQFSLAFQKAQELFHTAKADGVKKTAAECIKEVEQQFVIPTGCITSRRVLDAVRKSAQPLRPGSRGRKAYEGELAAVIMAAVASDIQINTVKGINMSKAIVIDRLRTLFTATEYPAPPARRFRRCTSTLRGWRLARTLARAKT
jgi:hypothetical protein